jgi:hypothetical protein
MVLPKNNVSSHAGFIAGFTAIAENIVRHRLGHDAQRRYCYGFSAGSMGRQVQYQPGANQGLDGGRLSDGFLLDDTGGGMWLPILKVDGKDVLFAGRDAERFVPQIDLSHALYLGDTGDFLKLNRENARLLAQKGLGARHRMYEIRGVSHFDAGQTSLPDLVPETLDLGGLMESFIDMLDPWVDNGIAPPPTRSDLAEIAGREGQSHKGAIALPEIACPLGERFVFPPAHGVSRRSFQETAFAAFDGTNLEPLDGHGRLVDMNHNGMRIVARPSAKHGRGSGSSRQASRSGGAPMWPASPVRLQTWSAKGSYRPDSLLGTSGAPSWRPAIWRRNWQLARSGDRRSGRAHQRDGIATQPGVIWRRNSAKQCRQPGGDGWKQDDHDEKY